ncbi:MAG TPA: beta-galactosidase, partial [Oculatellaceae cyanobacterium]
MQISYDRYSLLINGRREFIRSGAMHYFRLPDQGLWQDRLYKLKAAGYNAVDLYFCWDYHSPEPGVYDFTGIRDIRKLLQITQELGLYVIARPGPYINAEYSGGGFPGWLLAKRHLPLRNRREGVFEWSDEYMGYVEEWYRQVIPIINEAPNVILMQIENEYATLDVEPDYIQALYKLARELGVRVPLFHNDLYVAGLYEDIVDLYAFDNYSVTQFETDWREIPAIFQVLDNIEQNLRPYCQNRPIMAAELQAGWFGTWKGYRYELIKETLGREHIGITTKSLLGQGLTIFNHYKAIGGTNWDYTGSIETYTSYDFGAPISEAGVNTERLFESKALNLFLKSVDFTQT